MACFCLFVAIVLVMLCLVRTARAQDNYVPIYAASVGKALLNDKTVSKGKLILGINPNSGPHNQRLADSGQVIDKARADKVRLTFYIDAMVGRKFSPLLVKTDKGWKLGTVTSARMKTALEIRTERDAYLKLYGGEPFGWFIDDLNKGMEPLLKEVATWKGQIILNPGTHYQPPDYLRTCWVVIHEDESPWEPSMLTPWEKANLKRCIVMQLNQSPASLPAFADATKKMAARYASPLSDKGGAYNQKPLLMP